MTTDNESSGPASYLSKGEDNKKGGQTPPRQQQGRKTPGRSNSHKQERPMGRKTPGRTNSHKQNRQNSNNHYPAIHASKEEVELHMKFVDKVLTSIRCVNLKRRHDRWKTFKNHLEFSVGKELAQAFLKRLRRFDAIDGLPEDEKELKQINQTWDATENAKWDKHIVPPMTKQMTPGEVGCALSHIHLWKELAASYNGDEYQKPTMLILEDDALFYRTKLPEQLQQQRGRPLQPGQHNPGSKHQPYSSSSYDRNHPHGRHDSNKKPLSSHGFFTAFERAWAKLPEDWDIFYLGFSDRGDRIPVEEEEQFQEAHHHHHGHHSTMEIKMFKPTYGFHTHAYVITATAAKFLLDQLPVQGPLDVWLADNQWFGLKVYCSVIDNEGWNNTGAWLIPQDRKRIKKDSDIGQSGRTMSSD